MAKELAYSPLSGQVYYADMVNKGMYRQARSDRVDVTQSFIDRMLQFLGPDGGTKTVTAGEMKWEITCKCIGGSDG